MPTTNNTPTQVAATGSIGILGAGAMGTLFAARLAHSGTPVTLIDIDEQVLASLRSEGARCMTDVGPIRATVQALRASQLSHGPAMWLVFTKSAHTSSALQSIAHLLQPDTRFLSLQNGIGHVDALQAFAAPDRVALGITTWPARLLGAGHVSSLGQGSIRFMPCNGLLDPPFEQLAQQLNRAGLDCHLDPQVQQAIWEKLAFNAAFNGICGVTRCTVDGLANATGEALIAQVLQEVLAVAHASGVQASADRVNASVRNALENHLGHQPSMLQDLLAGRKTEVDAIHGAVTRAAEQLGIDVPVTRSLHQLISLCEHQPSRPT